MSRCLRRVNFLLPEQWGRSLFELHNYRSMSTSYYKILGVANNATVNQIKAAYRKLARKHHPDLNPGDPNANKKFQAINEANEVLSDPDKRFLYNIYGSDWKRFYKAGWSSSSDSYWEYKIRGFDYLKELKLSILHAAKGHSRTVKVEGREVRVRIPPGVNKSHTLVYYGCGGIGKNGGSNGDLHVHITVVDDPHWTLIGKDIHSVEPVDLFIALLGGEIAVDTLDGPVNVKIKPETPNGTKMRLRGKGYPAFEEKGPRGDFLVIIQVVLPCDLDPKEKRMFSKLAARRKSTGDIQK
jgi:curved DNA-binding protein